MELSLTLDATARVELRSPITDFTSVVATPPGCPPPSADDVNTDDAVTLAEAVASGETRITGFCDADVVLAVGSCTGADVEATGPFTETQEHDHQPQAGTIPKLRKCSCINMRI